MEAGTLVRKLSAIVSADVAGYSRLMAEDEAETVRTIGRYREEVRLLVGQYRGRLADFTGDNFLAEFPTATDAIACALEIHRVVEARNAGLPLQRRMHFRIGVHLGEVTLEDERLYGDGVNIAARLEGLAPPGGICISATVHDQVKKNDALSFDDLGPHELKNIPDPVRVYRVHPDVAVEVAPPSRQTWSPRVLASLALAGLGLIALGLAITTLSRGPSPEAPPPLALSPRCTRRRESFQWVVPACRHRARWAKCGLYREHERYDAALSAFARQLRGDSTHRNRRRGFAFLFAGRQLGRILRRRGLYTRFVQAVARRSEFVRPPTSLSRARTGVPTESSAIRAASM